MTRDDPLTAAISLVQEGNGAAARILLLEIWETAAGDPSRQCIVAHFLADTEAEVERELEWDLLALHAATGGGPGDNGDPATEGIAAFLPSLHLNVGDGYLRTGNRSLAALHARHGLARADALPLDGYGETVRTALERLLKRSTGHRRWR